MFMELVYSTILYGLVSAGSAAQRLRVSCREASGASEAVNCTRWLGAARVENSRLQLWRNRKWFWI